MLHRHGYAVVIVGMGCAVSKGHTDALRALREAKFARNAERAKVENGIRKAAAAGKEVLAKRKKKARKK